MTTKLSTLTILTMLLFSALNAHAATTTPPVKISGPTVGDTFARVAINPMVTAEGCTDQDWYIVDLTTAGGKETYPALLAAHAARQSVFFQLIGCHKNLPRISHLYVCETSNCR